MINFELPINPVKSAIRHFNIDGVKVGGENTLPFVDDGDLKFSPKFALEILLNIPSNYPEILKKYWANSIETPLKWAIAASKYDINFLAIEFNVDENDLDSDIQKSKKLLEEVLNAVQKPLILTGCGKPKIDEILLPQLADVATRPCIIGPLDEKNYKNIVGKLKNHFVIAKTPIDINLSKELNILISEQDFNPDNILIDPTMAGLGYGLDYAYSIVEKTKLAGLSGDNMLNMPIITYAGKEAWKAKEAKSADLDANWGNVEDRAIMWECMTASSIVSAGSNIAVMWHPIAIKALKDFMNEK